MMNRFAPALAGLLLAATAPALAISHATTPVNPETKDNLIATDTLIHVRLLQTVSSSRSHKGDRFDFEVVDDVLCGGGSRVVLPAGTRGTGKVASVSPAHGGRVDGHLHVVFDPIKLTDGTEIEIGITSASVNADANEHNSMAGDVMQVADMTIPGLFILDFLRKGDDITIAANRPFHIGVTQDAFLTSATAAVIPPTPVPTISPSAAPASPSPTQATPAPAAPSAPPK